jgi:hypothetical protein
MGKRRRILLASLLVVAVVGLLFLVAHQYNPEPVYHGKPLSAWLQPNTPGLYISIGQTTDGLREALNHIGTNAIPTLLRQLRAKDSPFTLKLFALAQKQHVITIHYTPPSSNYVHAFRALGILGPRADEAVPELVNIYERNSSPLFQQTMILHIGNIGPAARAAIPSLLRKVADTNDSVRTSAIQALGKIHSEPDLVVPALIKALNDPSATVRQHVLNTLVAFGAKAEPAVPALFELRESPYKNVRRGTYTGHHYGPGRSGSFADSQSEVEWALQQILLPRGNWLP